MVAGILRQVEPFGHPALARHGELGARAQLDSRTLGRGALESVATSMWQSAREFRITEESFTQAKDVISSSRVIPPSYSNVLLISGVRLTAVATVGDVSLAR
jgi:hypothetical protein